MECGERLHSCGSQNRATCPLHHLQRHRCQFKLDKQTLEFKQFIVSSISDFATVGQALNLEVNSHVNRAGFAGDRLV